MPVFHVIDQNVFGMTEKVILVRIFENII